MVVQSKYQAARGLVVDRKIPLVILPVIVSIGIIMCKITPVAEIDRTTLRHVIGEHQAGFYVCNPIGLNQFGSCIDAAGTVDVVIVNPLER